MKIEYSPFKKLIIYNIIKSSLEEFIERHLFIGNDIIPKWCDGYLLYFNAARDSPYIQEIEFNDRIVTWEYLEYVEMPDYTDTLNNKETNASCRVYNATSNSTFQEVVDWLKERE